MTVDLDSAPILRRRDRGPRTTAHVLRSVNVDDLSRPMPVTMKGISASGFTLRTSQQIQIGESHHFQFRFLDSVVEVDATCAHCARIGGTDAPVILAGFDFDPIGDRAARALATFVDSIISMAGGLRQQPEWLFA